MVPIRVIQWYRFADTINLMKIKGSVETWSDDFFPASNRIFSNVQTFEMNINSEELKNVKGQISLIMRCINKGESSFSQKVKGPHPFSLIVNVTENRTKNSLIEENLYDEMVACNEVELIATAVATAENQI